MREPAIGGTVGDRRILQGKAMRAARLNEGETRLAVVETDEPVLRERSAVVRVEAAFVAPYFSHLISSGHWQTPRRPFTVGQDAIGIVESVADGVTALSPGQRVYCDTFLRGHGTGDEGHCFIGAFAAGAGGLALQRDWPDGVLAERVVLPDECLVPVPGTIGVPPARLCRLGWIGTAWGALRRASLVPGERVAVNGASGLVGASAVLLSLAMGAGEVVAIGRRRAILEELRALDPRVVVDGGDARRDVDVVVDSVETDDPASTERAIAMLRRGGRAMVVGGVGAPLSLDYGWLMGTEATVGGSMWLARRDWSHVMALVASGSLDLSVLRARTFALDDINDAISAAAGEAGGLEHVAAVFP